MGEKRFDIYFRDPLKCIEALFSAPELCGELLLVPEQQCSDKTKNEQWFHEMNMGQWWWKTQVCDGQFTTMTRSTDPEPINVYY